MKSNFFAIPLIGISLISYSVYAQIGGEVEKKFMGRFEIDADSVVIVR